MSFKSLQLTELFDELNELQTNYGAEGLMPIYGAGCIKRPKFCLIFMNPTARNISANPEWKGLRAPWLGTKDVWRMFHKMGLIDESSLLESIWTLKPDQWSVKLAQKLYEELSKNSVYVTNLAKCTQVDARPLSNAVFNVYRNIMIKEIETIKPKYIVTFGNQVSSIVLNKSVSVSGYLDQDKFEILRVGQGLEFPLYPLYYPVGQGRRNMGKTIERFKLI